MERENLYLWMRKHLLGYCHSRWNGQGEDVLHEAWIIATERGYFHAAMLEEAARNLRLDEWSQGRDFTIITPRREKTRYRLILEVNTPGETVPDIPEKGRKIFQNDALFQKILSEKRDPTENEVSILRGRLKPVIQEKLF